MFENNASSSMLGFSCIRKLMVWWAVLQKFPCGLMDRSKNLGQKRLLIVTCLQAVMKNLQRQLGLTYLCPVPFGSRVDGFQEVAKKRRWRKREGHSEISPDIFQLWTSVQRILRYWPCIGWLDGWIFQDREDIQPEDSGLLALSWLVSCKFLDCLV